MTELKSLFADEGRTVTLVLVADVKLGAVPAYLVGGALSPEELTRVLAEGAFGDGAIEVVDSASGPEADVVEMLADGFGAAMFDALGLDGGGISEAFSVHGFAPVSSEEAFAQTLAGMEGAAFEDYTEESTVAFISGQVFNAGMLIAETVPVPQAKAVGFVLIAVGAAGLVWSADSAWKKAKEEEERGDGTTSADPEPVDDEDATIVASSDTDEEKPAEEEEPGAGEATTTIPDDPNVDGTGEAGGKPLPEDDPTEGTTDPQEDVLIFVAVDVNTNFEEHLQELILSDPEKFHAEIPDMDPFQLNETTQPGEGDALLFIFG